MDYRIIETGLEFPDILLHRDIHEDRPSVKILAWGFQCDLNVITEEIIEFTDPDSCKDFIEDYSKSSAVKWAIRNNLTYESK